MSRLNRLETFFRKPSCDFFFLLVVILLFCYSGFVESDAILIQLIPSLRSYRGTSYSLSFFFFVSQNARNCTAQGGRGSRIDVMNNACGFAHVRARKTRGIFMSILLATRFTIAHNSNSGLACNESRRGKERFARSLKLHSSRAAASECDKRDVARRVFY